MDDLEAINAASRILHIGSDMGYVGYLSGLRGRVRAVTVWLPEKQGEPTPVGYQSPYYCIWPQPLTGLEEAIKDFSPGLVVVDLYSYSNLRYVTWASGLQLPMIVSSSWWPENLTRLKHLVDVLTLAEQRVGKDNLLYALKRQGGRTGVAGVLRPNRKRKHVEIIDWPMAPKYRS